jgi:hypothetical protein
LSGSIYVGTRAGTLQAPPAFDEYSGVILTVSDEVEYTAGKTTGKVLEVSCPWGTQKVANRILARIRGYQYQPFTAAGVDLNPAAQLGDGVTIENTYGGLYSIETQYGAVSLSDIAAPGEEELDHEFAYEPKSQREVRRRFKNVESRLSIQADEISAKVSAVDGSSSFSWELTKDYWRIKAKGKTILKVSEDGFWFSGDGTFTGNIYAKNIQSGGSAGYIGTGVLSSGIQTSLARADFSKRVFEGTGSATLLRCESMIFDDYIIARQSVTINGQTIRYLGWTYPSPL